MICNKNMRQKLIDSSSKEINRKVSSEGRRFSGVWASCTVEMQADQYHRVCASTQMCLGESVDSCVEAARHPLGSIFRGIWSLMLLLICPLGLEEGFRFQEATVAVILHQVEDLVLEFLEH